MKYQGWHYSRAIDRFQLRSYLEKNLREPSCLAGALKIGMRIDFALWRTKAVKATIIHDQR